jgi:twitching motility protein PilI
VKGIASLRGQLLTVIDLRSFLGGGATRIGRDTRVVVLNHRDLVSGLLVDEVYGFRRFPDTERGETPPEGELRCRRYLDGAFDHGEETWPVFSLYTLAESPNFLLAAQDD